VRHEDSTGEISDTRRATAKPKFPCRLNTVYNNSLFYFGFLHVLQHTTTLIRYAKTSQKMRRYRPRKKKFD